MRLAPPESSNAETVELMMAMRAITFLVMANPP
jgi:hypothetical protein